MIERAKHVAGVEAVDRAGVFPAAIGEPLWELLAVAAAGAQTPLFGSWPSRARASWTASMESVECMCRKTRQDRAERKTIHRTAAERHRGRRASKVPSHPDASHDTDAGRSENIRDFENYVP